MSTPRPDSRRHTECARLRRVFEDSLAVGAFAPVQDLWSCWLLRFITASPRDKALPQHRASDHRRLRSARRLGVVLRRRSDVRSDRSNDAAQRANTEIRLTMKTSTLLALSLLPLVSIAADDGLHYHVANELPLAGEANFD